MIKVLFVCLGNICRSPLGEGLFRHHVTLAGLEDRFVIDSAGTGNWHVGEQPHVDSQRVARNNGIDLSCQRARQIRPEDLLEFDYILAMDSQNHMDILGLHTASQATAVIKRMMDFAPERGLGDVPDPYFGGPEGFEYTYELLDEASRGLLEHILAERAISKGQQVR